MPEDLPTTNKSLKELEKNIKRRDKMKNEIIIFENQGVKLEVNMKDETGSDITIWPAYSPSIATWTMVPS